MRISVSNLSCRVRELGSAHEVLLRCGECKLEGKVKLRMKEAACFTGRMGTDFRAGVPSTAATKKEEAESVRTVVEVEKERQLR